MSISRPTLSEIQQRIIADLIQSINIGESDTSKHIDPTIRNSLIRGIMSSMAAGFDENYDGIEQLQLDLFPWSTEDDAIVQDWATTFGLTQKTATNAAGSVTFSGTATTLIPAGTELQRANGLQYTTDALGTISTSTVNISGLTFSGGLATATTATDHNLASGITIDSITGATESEYNVTNVIITVTGSNTFTYAVTGSPSTPATGSPQVTYTTASVAVTSSEGGSNYNADAGSELSLVSPIAGVDNSAYVQNGGVTGGTDIETTEELRVRVNERTANFAAPFSVAGLPPFIKENNTGVTRIWVQRATPAAGSTTIYFIRGNDTNIIPTSAQANAVKATITNDDTGILPANMSVSSLIVSPPTAVPVDITFSALSPDTADMQTAITASLTDYFKNEANVEVDIALDDLKRVISNTIDSNGSTPTYTLSAPASDVTISTGELGTIGTITYP